MDVFELEPLINTGQINRARVVSLLDDGSVILDINGAAAESGFDVLDTLISARLVPGDEVLAWHNGREDVRGVIIGRISRTTVQSTEVAPTPDAATSPDLPETLLLQANREITLRVGDGSITIRADGKILIKGKDLVSHAQRVNRIRGGSVTIN